MMEFLSELLVCSLRELGRATAIAAILFTFNVVTSNAQDFEPEELQPQSPSSSSSPSHPSSSPLLMEDDDIMSENSEEIIFNSSEIYDATDRATNISTTITSLLDKSDSVGKMTLRWSNVAEIAARTLHIFNTECRPNEIALSGTWVVGSAQYLSVIANYPSIKEEGQEPHTENNFSWIVIVFNLHESNSFPAAGGVLCESSTDPVNATTIAQLPITEENQQEEGGGEEMKQPEIIDTESPFQQEVESVGGGMTATLNSDNFTTGDTITINGSVEERGSESFVTIQVIDPQNKTVESAIIDITPENRFTHSFLAGVQEEFDFDDPMVARGNYMMIVRYIAPDFQTEVVEFIFEYNGNTGSVLGERTEAASNTGEFLAQQAPEGYNGDDDSYEVYNNTGQATTSPRVSIVPGAISLTNIAYQPSPALIRVGDTITWTNNDLEPHSVTSGKNAQADGRFDSGIMAPTRTFEHTFTQLGQYPYFCILHPNMIGTVIVIG